MCLVIVITAHVKMASVSDMVMTRQHGVEAGVRLATVVAPFV